MRTDAYVDSDGMLVLIVSQTAPDGLVQSKTRLSMHLSDGGKLAEQIRAAVAAFPPSAEDSPAWVEANR